MTTAELILSLAKKAGIADDNQELKTLLSDAALGKAIPQNLTDAIEANLMNVDAAIASKPVRDALRKTVEAEIYNGMDKEIDNLTTVAGFEADELADIKKHDTTYKRLRAVSSKLDGLIKKKSTAKPGDQAELTLKINEAREEITRMKTEHETKLKEQADAFAVKEDELLLDGILGEYSYANEAAGKRPNVITARTILREGLSEIGAKLIRENGQFKLVKQDGTDYYDAKQTKVDFKTFTEQRIAPLLKAADPNKGKGAGPGTGGQGDDKPLLRPPSSDRSPEGAYAELRAGMQ